MKNAEPRTKLVFLIICFFFYMISAHSFSSAYAADPLDKLSKITKQLKTKIQNLTEVKKEEKSIVSKIEDLNSNISSKEKELSQYNKRISQSRSQIKSVSKEIGLINDKLESSQHLMDEHVVALYKRQYNNDAMMLMSADDYSDLIKKSRYISLAAYHNNKVLTEYKNALKKVNSQKRNLEKLQTKLETNKNTVNKKKKEFQSDLANKDRLLKEVKARRISQEERIKYLEASSRKIMSMVNKLKTKTMPKEIIGKGFRAFKGQLPWPVEGDIVAQFGKYKDPEFDLEGFRNGIEIEGKPGESPKAIAGGRVVYANSFKGFDNMLIIDHGNGYHSVYGKLSEMSLETGDLLINGMDIGTVNASGNPNVSVLYFEIRYKGKPINPINWLKKKGVVQSASK